VITVEEATDPDLTSPTGSSQRPDPSILPKVGPAPSVARKGGDLMMRLLIQTGY